jgi:hypothetical protein
MISNFIAVIAKSLDGFRAIFPLKTQINSKNMKKYCVHNLFSYLELLFFRIEKNSKNRYL